MKTTYKDKTPLIKTFENVQDFAPVTHELYEDKPFQVLRRCNSEKKAYLSPNRRNFYKVLFIYEGESIFTLGLDTYHIEKPTLIFIHPSDIISKRDLTDLSSGYFAVFQRGFIENAPSLKSIINAAGIFSDKRKCVLTLDRKNEEIVRELFDKMCEESKSLSSISTQVNEAYLQLMILISSQIQDLPRSEEVSEEFKHIHYFFQLLEEEMVQINLSNPLQLRTAAEFAAKLGLHPNYLNSILKQCTGDNLSTHIKKRLLQESKIILSNTNLTLGEISYIFGFSDQPYFSNFFKKNTGLTPATFRKGNAVKFQPNH